MHEHMYIDMYAHTCIEIYINLLDYTHTYSKRLIKIMSVHILQKFLSTFVKVFNSRLHFCKKKYNAKSPAALVWNHRVRVSVTVLWPQPHLVFLIRYLLHHTLQITATSRGTLS